MEERRRWAADRAHAVAGTIRFAELAPWSFLPGWDGETHDEYEVIEWVGGLVGEEWITAAHRPLPIGYKSILADPMISDEAAKFAVFEDDATLLLPLVAEIDFTRVEVFFTVRHRGVSTIRNAWRSDRSRIRITREYTSEPLSPEVTAFIEGARAWWRNFGGLVASGGRPSITALTEDVAIEVWLELFEGSGGFDPVTKRELPYRSPRTGEVVQRLRERGIDFSDSTFHARKQRWKRYPPPQPEMPD